MGGGREGDRAPEAGDDEYFPEEGLGVGSSGDPNLNAPGCIIKPCQFLSGRRRAARGTGGGFHRIPRSPSPVAAARGGSFRKRARGGKRSVSGRARDRFRRNR